MGKILVVSFDDDEKAILQEILCLLEKRGGFSILHTVTSNKRLEFENLVIILNERMVKVKDAPIELTNFEFEILYLLAKSPGQVFSKEQIYAQVWNAPYYGAEDNVMSLIRRIRKKIEPNPSKPIYILTVWGIGYKFNNAIKRK